MNEKQQDYTHKMNENGVPVYQQLEKVDTEKII